MGCSSLSRPIVVCHCPGNGQKSKEEGERFGAPSRTVGKMSEDPAGRLFVWGQVQKRDADTQCRGD